MYGREEDSVIAIMIFLSLMAFLIAIAALVYLVKMQSNRNLKRGLLKSVFFPFVISIFFLRMSTALFFKADYGWNLWESIADGVVRTLLIFNIDEANLNMLDAVKVMCDDIFGSDIMTTLVAGYSALLNIVAPITGGVIIFDILCDVFPKMKLKVQSGRRKYIFSAINEKTVFLAESINQFENAGKKGLAKKGKASLIFTNSYFSNDDESSAELLRRAKELGGICVKEDISLFRIPGKAEITYILQNEDDLKNINMLTEMVDADKGNYAELCRDLVGHNRACRQGSDEKNQLNILLFSQDDYADDIVKAMYSADDSCPVSRLEQDYVFIKVVREYTNLVYQLLWNVPLYSVLDEKKIIASDHIDQKISILIIGFGDVGREMLIAGYWCGQFGYAGDGVKIKKFPLEIHVVDKDALAKKSQLEMELPGIDFNNSDDYCEFHFYDRDVKTKEFSDMFNVEGELHDVNYVVISLGNDIENLNAARKIQREMELAALTRDYKFRINYVMKNENMNNSLEALHRRYGKEKIRVFGSISERYGMRNVFATELEKRAILVDNTHRDLANVDVDKEVGKIGFLNNEYQRRSSSAAAIHVKYKAFAIGWDGDAGDDENGAKIKKHMDYLAWLEHQRWNAYMRGIGYKRPTNEQFAKMKSQKDLELGLHGALCESGEGCGIDSGDAWKKNENSEYDDLDNLSLMMHAKRKEKYSKLYGFLTENREDNKFSQLGAEYMKKVYVDPGSPLEYNEDKQEFRKDFEELLKDKQATDELRKAFESENAEFQPDIAGSLLLPDDYKRYDYSQLKAVKRILDREKIFPMAKI